MPTPVADRAAAIDSLLDARSNLAHIRDSTLPGTALYLAIERALREVDEAVCEIRSLT